MTNDYIRREDAVNAVEFGITLASKIDLETGEWTELFQRENDELREAVERIKDIEPVDVVPVVHAIWSYRGNHRSGLKVCECSNCNRRAFGSTDYCPNCGAKMDAQGEE